jgi:hypothetical protein
MAGTRVLFFREGMRRMRVLFFRERKEPKESKEELYLNFGRRLDHKKGIVGELR